MIDNYPEAVKIISEEAVNRIEAHINKLSKSQKCPVVIKWVTIPESNNVAVIFFQYKKRKIEIFDKITLADFIVKLSLANLFVMQQIR